MKNCLSCLVGFIGSIEQKSKSHMSNFYIEIFYDLGLNKDFITKCEAKNGKL